VVPSAETDDLVLVFDNREVGVPHNVVITSLAGSPDEPESGDETFVSTAVVEGPTLDAFRGEDLGWQDLPDEWYFFCAIHPNMNGVGRVVGPEG